VSATITQPTGMALSETHIDANCNQSNGSATVSVTGGTGPYTYLWSDAAAQTTQTATLLPSNTYVVSVTDAMGCVQNLTVTVGDLAGPVASVFSINHVSCYNDNDGSATVTVTGGVPPFNFLWSNAQTLPTATNLIAGTYTLTATDVNGCIATTSVTITEPTFLDATVVTSNPTCAGSCNGSFISTAFGGTAPYSYLWNPGGLTTPNVTGLCNGSYTLQVTDANGCIALEPVVLIDPVPVTGTTTVTNVSCSGVCDGTATAAPASGTGPFTYLWTDINAQTTQTATGLCAGTYSVTISDANGCSAQAQAIITSPASLTASITSQGNVTCFNACDGFASATVSGGSAPYSYLWMPGSTAGASVNNLCAATYTVTVTDANGCTANTTVTITQPFALVATITSTNATCYNVCDATATAVYTGGTGPYTFQWSPTFLTTPTILNICDGVHNLTVTDNNGCTAIASVVITEPTLLAVSTTTTNSSCGNADGEACAAITGGVPPFTYLWNDPASQTTPCASNINAGAYTISITDGNGCSVTGPANVNDNGAPVVTIPVSSNVTCAGAANGSAQASIVGGIIPYNIMWTPGGQTTAFANNLPGGIYSVVVTDSVGCTGSVSVTINEPALLVSGITASSNVSCNLTCDGTATVNAGGGTAPYTYLWNDPGTQTTFNATGLCAQGYTVTVTDANGCISTSNTMITSPTAVAIALANTTDVDCFGGNDGEIQTTVSGGTPGYTYQWTPGVGSAAQVTNLVSGSYFLLVTDQNGCTDTMTTSISEPPALVLTTDSIPSTCGNSNGSVSVLATGGVPGYTYLWNDASNQTTASATGLSAGAYNIIVSDTHGCVANASAILTDNAGPTSVTMSFTQPLCNGTALGGTATAVPVGGQPLYSYLWTGIGAQTTQTATSLVAGVYSVTVTDANGCTISNSVVVSEPTPTQIIVSPTDTICQGELAQIYGSGYGGSPTYTYTWTPALFTGAGPHVVNPSTTSFYDVYVTDNNGCISPASTITVFVNPPVSVVATDLTVCVGSAVTISANATGGNGGPYTYTWSNAVSGQSQSVSPSLASSPMDYIVTVDDGCSFLVTDTATVTVNPLALGSMSVNDTAGCEDHSVIFSGFSDIGTNYTWNFGDGSPTATGEPMPHTYTSPGSYDVTLTVGTALGCYSTFSITQFVDVFPAPVAEFSSAPLTVTSVNPTVSFTDLSLGAIDWNWDFVNQLPYTGLYTDSIQNPVFNYADTGTYNVQLIVTNGFGCADTAYHFVEVLPEYVIYAPNAFTPNNNDGLNDLFMPKGVGINPDNFELTIFDRWGNLIFKTNDINKGWDGKANGGGKVAQSDVYVWKITTEDPKGDQHIYIGHITIIK
nr:gliding motility-associated C-terminal domain-containing protein [Bacteroidota bacterium]